MTGGLRSCPKGDEDGNQQPEQSFHEEEKKSPKTETLYPLSYWHMALIVLASGGALQEIQWGDDSFTRTFAP